MKVQPQDESKPVRDPAELTKDFLDEYDALCKKHGLVINVNPAYVRRDDGTWSVVLQTGVGRLPSRP